MFSIKSLNVPSIFSYKPLLIMFELYYQYEKIHYKWTETRCVPQSGPCYTGDCACPAQGGRRPPRHCLACAAEDGPPR